MGMVRKLKISYSYFILHLKVYFYQRGRKPPRLPSSIYIWKMEKPILRPLLHKKSFSRTVYNFIYRFTSSLPFLFQAVVRRDLFNISYITNYFPYLSHNITNSLMCKQSPNYIPNWRRGYEPVYSAYSCLL